jgi:hypothetical protein
LAFDRGEDGTYIYDSRQGDVDRYKISALEEEILKMLDTPCSVDDLLTHFPDETGEGIASVLRHLDDKRLVFKENDRYMSLVIRDYSEEEIEFIVEACDYRIL